MSRYNRCNECYNMKCVFVTGERQDFDTSECADFRPMTNADRIRAMTDEELAEWIELLLCPSNCPDEQMGEACARTSCDGCWLSWLKSTVEEGDG